MDKKAKEEDDYFRNCQREARSKNNKKVGSKDDTSPAREEELFGKQIVKGINFEKYNEIKVEVKVPTDDTSNNGKQAVSAMEDFANLPHLNSQLKRNIQLMKYTHPTPIQKWAIPFAMSGEDLMSCAQTGSGKLVDLFTVLAAGIRASGLCFIANYCNDIIACFILLSNWNNISTRHQARHVPFYCQLLPVSWESKSSHTRAATTM
jgi:hypothetical protein